jgi:hypothetical protein
MCLVPCWMEPLETLPLTGTCVNSLSRLSAAMALHNFTPLPVVNLWEALILSAGQSDRHFGGSVRF